MFGISKAFNDSMDHREMQERTQSLNTTTGAVRNQAAKVAAQTAGLSGVAAIYFAYGYGGASIKSVDPRKAGFEKEFRAGRDAWNLAKNDVLAAARKLEG